MSRKHGILALVFLGLCRIAAADTTSITTTVGAYPLQERFLAGWRLYDPSNCNTVTTGQWTIVLPPARGQLRIATDYLYSSAPCDNGKTYKFGTLYYTWTSRDPIYQSDQVQARWEGSSGSGYVRRDYTFKITLVPPKVSIKSADFANNKITIELVGGGSYASSGKATLTLLGNNNKVVQVANGGATLSPGTYVVGFSRPSIPEDLYGNLRAEWETGWAKVSSSQTLTPSLAVLGTIRHSQYNTPAEIKCPITSATAWVFDAQCNFTKTTLRSQFMSMIKLNGTGRSAAYGTLKYDSGARCSGKYPVGATTSNSFLNVIRSDSQPGSCCEPGAADDVGMDLLEKRHADQSSAVPEGLVAG